MGRLWKGLLVVGVVAFLAAPAFAQPPGPPPGGFPPGGFMPGGGGGAMLLLNPGVQKELKLTDDQIDKGRTAVTKIWEKYQPELQALADLSAEERREKGQALMKKLTEEVTKATSNVLKPEQVKRLDQITLQQRGAGALSDADIQKKLKLTDEQKTKLKKITDDAAKSRQDIFAAGRGPETGKKMEAIRKETMEKATAILTDAQAKTWKEMTGTPFEVRFEFGKPGERKPGESKPKEDKPKT